MDETLQLTLHLSPKQYEAYQYLNDDITTEIGFGGGAGGGKSILGTYWVWEKCMQYPGSRWFFGRKELKRLKETTLQSYYKLLKIINAPTPYWGTFNNLSNSIKFSNGSEILLLDLANKPSDQEFQTFGSLEFTGGFIDESAEINRKAIMILSTRIGRRRNEEFGLTPKLLETFNPDKGHIYDRYYLAKKKGILPPYRQFIVSLVTDNPYIDKNYIAQLEKADIVTKQRLLYGNFEYDDDTLKVYTIQEIYDAFTNPSTIHTHTKYIVADIARYGNDTIRIGVWEDDDLLEIITMRKMGTDETIEEIKKLELQHKVRRSNICIDVDGVGGGVVDGLRGCLSFSGNAIPYQEYNSKFMHKNFANLKTQCVFKLKEKMEKGVIRLNMSTEDKELFIQEAENVRIKDPALGGKMRVEEKYKLKQVIGRSPDIYDMVMMKQVYDVKKIVSSNPSIEPIEQNWDGLL